MTSQRRALTGPGPGPLFAVLVLLAAACRPDAGGHGHDHGSDHGHGHGPASPDEPEPFAFTRWAGGHELFVEFPPPDSGKTLSFHAHLTRLSDFSPARAGRFAVRFARGSTTVAETSIEGVKRPGIFTPELEAPAAGEYALTMSYQHGDERAQWDLGTLVIPSEPTTAQGAGEIAFLKEAQWRIPFATELAETRPLSREIELPTTVEPAASERLTIGAPTGGRFFHASDLALAEGQAIQKGTLLGRISPTVEGDDLSRLELAVDTARIGRQRVDREIARVKPLVEKGLLPEKRLTDLTGERAQIDAELSAAKRRLGRVLSPGGKGGVPIRSNMEGVIAEVRVPNGEPVEAGATLLRLRGSRELWLRSRFVARPEGELSGARPVAVRLADGKRRALPESSRFVSTVPTIDPETRVGTWIARAVTQSDDALTVGQSAVLIVRVGEPKRVVTVPVGAVVDIDTRAYVFVQKGGETFEKRRVVLGRRDAKHVEVMDGVKEGERVVARGGFDVHLASLTGAIESHRH